MTRNQKIAAALAGVAVLIGAFFYLEDPSDSDGFAYAKKPLAEACGMKWKDLTLGPIDDPIPYGASDRSSILTFHFTDKAGKEYTSSFDRFPSGRIAMESPRVLSCPDGKQVVSSEACYDRVNDALHHVKDDTFYNGMTQARAEQINHVDLSPVEMQIYREVYPTLTYPVLDGDDYDQVLERCRARL